jgi:Ca2+:H+ antiporter
MPPSISRRQLLLLALVLVLTVATAVLQLAGAPKFGIFFVSAGALAGLAWLVSFATEAVGTRFGPAVTGFLQSTLGNLPELFIVLFALNAGELVIARFSILGSLFANALLVLGGVIVAGAWKAGDGVMRFARRLPNDTATLLLLAVFTIVLLGASDKLNDRASRHQLAISIVGAVVLLGVYVAFLSAYLRSDEAAAAGGEEADARLPLPWALGLLAASGVGAAFVSDWFVGSLDTAVDRLGISKAFTGLVIVAIAGNAVENVVGIALAAKGQNDLAISVVKNSVAQVAAFLFPALVLLSLFFSTRLTFVLNPVYIGALLITALAVWQVTGDGEAAAFEGWALVGLFVILAGLTYFE